MVDDLPRGKNKQTFILLNTKVANQLTLIITVQHAASVLLEKVVCTCNIIEMDVKV